MINGIALYGLLATHAGEVEHCWRYYGESDDNSGPRSALARGEYNGHTYSLYLTAGYKRMRIWVDGHIVEWERRSKDRWENKGRMVLVSDTPATTLMKLKLVL